MDCTVARNAHPLSYCPAADALLHVGELNPYTAEPPMLWLKNLATGRVQVVHLDQSEMPGAAAILPNDMVPGQFYEIRVVGLNDVSGAAPIPFSPYVMDPTTGTYTSVDFTVDSVAVKFLKLHTAGDGTHSFEEQWIQLQ